MHFDEAELRLGPVDEGHASHQQARVEVLDGHQ